MTAIAKDRSTPEMALLSTIAALTLPVAAGEVLFAGTIGAYDANGNLVDPTLTTGLTVCGRIETAVDNTTGADGAKSTDVKAGVFPWENGESITNANRGDVAYVADNQTVKLTGTGASECGIIVDVRADGKVMVATGLSNLFSNPAPAPDGQVLKKTHTFDASITGSADTDGTATSPINVGTALPTGAIILAVQVSLDTAPLGGSPLANLKLDLGWVGATESLVKDLELVGATDGDVFDHHDGGSAPSIGFPTRAGGKQVQAILTPSGSTKVSEITSFDMTVDVFYTVAF